MGTRSTYAKPQVRKRRISARSGGLRRIPVLTTLGEDLGNTARQTWADSGKPGQTWADSGRSGQCSRAKEKAPRTNAWGLNLLLSKLKSFLLVRSRRTRNFAARWLSCRAQPHCCSSAPKAHACCLGTRPVVSRHGNRASLANSYAGRQPAKQSQAGSNASQAKPAEMSAKPAD